MVSRRLFLFVSLCLINIFCFADAKFKNKMAQCNININTLIEDPYKTLGVEQDAPFSKIKKSYRQLSKQYHPDKVTDEEAKKKYNEKFLQVSEAYQLLSDENMRKRVDECMSGDYDPSEDFWKYFGDFFKREKPQEERRSQRERESLDLGEKLMINIANRDIKGVRECIGMGVDLNVKHAYLWGKKQFPLNLAICNNEDVSNDKDNKKKVKILKLLIDAGAKMNDGRALHNAVGCGEIEIVEFLVNKVADVNAKDHYGRTALFLACFDERKDMVRILLDAGADANAKDKDGWTPLIHVVQHFNYELDMLLIEGGADVEMAMDIAIEQSLSKIQDYLRPYLTMEKSTRSQGSSYSKSDVDTMRRNNTFRSNQLNNATFEDGSTFSDTSGGGVGPDLSGLDFSNSTLRDSWFTDANLDGANFNGADLTDAHFSGSSRNRTTFEGAVLKNATGL